MKYFYVLVSLWLIKCGCFLNHRVKLSTISRFSHIDNVLPESFNQVREIPDWLKVRCAELGYTTPTPVQSEAIPVRSFGHLINLFLSSSFVDDIYWKRRIGSSANWKWQNLSICTACPFSNRIYKILNPSCRYCPYERTGNTSIECSAETLPSFST